MSEPYVIESVLETKLCCKHAFMVSFNGCPTHRYDIDLSDPLPEGIGMLDTDAEKIDALLTFVAAQHAEANKAPAVAPEAVVAVVGGKIDPTAAKAAYAVLKAEKEAAWSAEAEAARLAWEAGEPERVKAAEELAAKTAAAAELKALAAALAVADAAEALEAAKLKAAADAKAAAEAAEALVVQQAVDAAVAEATLKAKIETAVADALVKLAVPVEGVEAVVDPGKV